MENWHKDFGTVEDTEDKGSHSKLVKIWILAYTTLPLKIANFGHNGSLVGAIFKHFLYSTIVRSLLEVAGGADASRDKHTYKQTNIYYFY